MGRNYPSRPWSGSSTTVPHITFRAKIIGFGIRTVRAFGSP
ncbi:hypothetical protein [Streptomyces nigra]